MSEHTMMSVKEARELVDDHRFADAEQQRAAHTIIALHEQVDRVRAVNAGLLKKSEAALQRWEAYDDPHDGAAFDTLRDTARLLTEALEGEA